MQRQDSTRAASTPHGPTFLSRNPAQVNARRSLTLFVIVSFIGFHLFLLLILTREVIDEYNDEIGCEGYAGLRLVVLLDDPSHHRDSSRDT
jgi:hypothetical protein